MTTVLVVSSLAITGLTGTSAFLVGLQEANDPEHSRPDDLIEFEKTMIDRDV